MTRASPLSAIAVWARDQHARAQGPISRIALIVWRLGLHTQPVELNPIHITKLLLQQPLQIGMPPLESLSLFFINTLESSFFNGFYMVQIMYNLLTYNLYHHKLLCFKTFHNCKEESQIEQLKCLIKSIGM